MRTLCLITGLALTVSCASQSMAAPVMFYFSGTSSGGYTAKGSFTIDNSLFDGTTTQELSNTDITSLTFIANTPNGLVFFNTADLDTTGANFYNSSVTPATVFDGTGNLGLLAAYALGIFAGATDINGNEISEDYVGVWTDPSATPLPAALPLFATGLGVMGLFGWRRKRKNAAAIAA